MKEYYCLLLNNCYDKKSHWVCQYPFSMFPNILEKDIPDLDSLESKFMDLDDTIIQKEETYHVLGSFPVLGEIQEDGKMHDVITGKIIQFAKDSKEANGLSYRAKYRAFDPMADELLTLISANEKQRYLEALTNLEVYSKKVFYGIDKPERYFALNLNNAPITPVAIVAKELNGQIVDVITKEKIYPVTDKHIVTSKLSTDYETMRVISEEMANRYQISLIDYGIEKYLEHVRLTKINTISNYNNYVTITKDKPKVRTK